MRVGEVGDVDKVVDAVADSLPVRTIVVLAVGKSEDFEVLMAMGFEDGGKVVAGGKVAKTVAKITDF